VAASSKFFDIHKNLFLHTFIETLQNSTFKPNTYLTPIPTVNMMVNSTTSGFRLTDTTFDDKSVVFHIQEDKPQINASLSNISLTFMFEYNITTTPELVEEVG
jgi:hypothetical protein